MVNYCKARVIAESVAPNKYLGGQSGVKHQTLCLLDKHVEIIIDADGTILDHYGVCDCDCDIRFRKVRLPYDVAMSLLK